uniref:Uncharacterized protein n=1 Tax=Anguilla anguilla TaxID=7936 RepID=A0A0E9Q4Z3_ANGAN
MRNYYYYSYFTLGCNVLNELCSNSKNRLIKIICDRIK